MSRCDLEVLLDRSGGRFVAGEVVEGRVRVRANQDFESDGLQLSLTWFTHGKGNRDLEVVDRETRGTVPWRVGEVREFPFAFTLPNDGPASYDGQVLNIAWEVGARLDVNWAIDPKASASLVVDRHVDPSRELPVVGDPMGPGSMPRALFHGVFMLMAGIFFLGGLVALLGIMGGVVLGMAEFSDVLGFGFFFLVWTGFSLAAFLRIAKPYIAQLRTGKIEIELAPGVARPGGGVRAMIRMKPPRDLPLNGIKARLVFRESAVSGSGTSRVTHTHEEPEMEVEACGARSIQRGASLTEEVHLRIPSEATATFRAPDNAIEWVVIVDVDIDGWPDFQRDLPVYVV